MPERNIHRTPRMPPAAADRRRAFAVFGALTLLFAAPGPAQTNTAPGTSAPSVFGLPPRQWAVDVVNNEIAIIEHHGPYLRYRAHTVDEKGDRVRDTVESTGITVARLLLMDGKPLDPDQDSAERDRLNTLLASPSGIAKRSRTDLHDKKLAIDLIHLMPDAMSYIYTPGQPQTQSSHPGLQVVLDFQPNPAWSPPNTTAEALTGLRGRVWIDAQSRQLIRIEGNVFKGVNFGWGMLAHIYPGGLLSLDQTSVNPASPTQSQANSNSNSEGRWIYTRFSEHLTVRALMLKTITVNTTIDATGFQPLSGSPSPQESIRLLLATPPRP